MAGTILSFIILLVAHASAGIYSSTPKYSKRTTYIIWGVWIAIQCGTLFVAEFVFTNGVLKFLLGFVLSLIGQYAIFFITTRGKLAQRIFTILTYSTFFCIAMSLFSIVNGSFTSLHWIPTVLIQAILLTAIVLYFLRYVCPLCRAASKNITTGWMPLIFVNAVFIITIILSSIFPVRLTSFSDPAFITFVFLSISIMAVYPVIFSNINNMSEAAMKREVEAQNKLLLAQIEAETIQLEADSQARHDRRHHNLIMLEYANNNDIESVREYLRGLVEGDTEAYAGVKYCDNITVNTILSVYEGRAKDKGIKVNIKASAAKNLPVIPKDLVIIIANVFENAINAVLKLKNAERYISISVKETPERLLIIAENPCKEKMVFDESCYGVGIQSIISTVNKYEGMYDFSATNGMFSAKISVNLK